MKVVIGISKLKGLNYVKAYKFLGKLLIKNYGLLCDEIVRSGGINF